MSVAALGRDQRHPAFDTSLVQLLSNFDGGAPAVEIDDWLVNASDAVGCVRLKDT